MCKLTIDSSEYPLLTDLRDEKGFEYGVITPGDLFCLDGQILYFGFNSRKDAMDKANELSRHGRWCEVYGLRDMNLIAYLTGYAVCK